MLLAAASFSLFVARSLLALELPLLEPATRFPVDVTLIFGDGDSNPPPADVDDDDADVVAVALEILIVAADEVPPPTMVILAPPLCATVDVVAAETETAVSFPFEVTMFIATKKEINW